MSTTSGPGQTEGTVMTVTGAVPASALRMVDMHDHLMIEPGPATDRDPDLSLGDEQEAITEAGAFLQAGGGAILDAMPTGCGRAPEALRRISEATGVAVISTSGFHLESYYHPGHWRFRYPIDVQVHLLVDECESGMDRYDYCGPVVDRSPVRPGVLKVAGGFSALSAQQRRAIEVVAQVHRATGLSVITHCEHGTAGDLLLDTLEDAGVAPGRVALGHVDRNPDAAVLLALVARGAYLTFDGLYRERYRPLSVVLEVIRILTREGFVHRLLLGGDIARRSLRISAGSRGVAGVITEWARRVEEVSGPGAVHDLMTVNPREFLEIRPP